MSTLNGLLQIGNTGLQINQLGTANSGNNITNAQVPGYSRRDLLIDEGRGPLPGGGVVEKGVVRAEDFILSQRLVQEQGNLSQGNVAAGGLREIEQALQAGQTNLSQKVNDLGNSLTQLGAAPADPAQRTDVIQKGQAVVDEFNRVGQLLGVLQNQNLQHAQGLVPEINALAVKVATLNGKAISGVPGAAPPEVTGPNAQNLDDRDRAVSSLADLTGGQVLRNSDGTVDVLVGGLSLVHGTAYNQLAVSDQAGALSVTVGGQGVQQVIGGQLGGFVLAHDAAQQILGQFDQLAYSMSQVVNAQHALGVGLDGVGGRPFFAPLFAPAGAAISLKLDGQLTATTLAAGLSAQPGDNRNALALANLTTQPVLQGGKATFSTVFSGIVSTLGSDIQQADGNVAIAKGQKDALDQAQATVAGVSTDEELTKLQAYQQGFQASAKFIQTVNSLMATLNTDL